MMIFEQDLDREVLKCIHRFEAEHNCIIFLAVDNGMFEMTVAYPAGNRVEGGIKLCGVNESKYALASAIRKHFVKE